MENLRKIPFQLGVESRMTANTLVPVCFNLSQINLEQVKERKIPFEITEDSILLYLKAVLDGGGASDNLVSEDGLGYCITDKGMLTKIKSILDEKTYSARKVNVHLKTGAAQLLIVKELSKPKNEVSLMKVLRKQLQIPESKYKYYNIDDDFLSRDIDLIIGVVSCRVYHRPLDVFKKFYLHPKLQLVEAESGIGLSFQGQMGAQLKDFQFPLKK